MKYIFDFIIFLIVAFFVWNSLKRIFFSTFYRFPQQPKQQPPQNNQQRQSKNGNNHGLNWDAEEAEFEEIKEEEKLKK